jgi:hypothetical protein
MSIVALRGPRAFSVVAVGFLVQSLFATLVPSLSFEQLTDTSELIVNGTVTRSWTAWDSEHKYIWTHYDLKVTSVLKGSPAATVELAEPGGSLDGKTMIIAGTVNYAVGENVVAFLSRMPNGYLRTTGWAQGRYAVDAAGRIHSSAALGAETIDAKTPSTGSSLRTLEGTSLSDLGTRIAARLAAAKGGVK